MVIEDYEHEHTDEIVCPYCKYEFTDSWEVPFDDESMDDTREVTCGSCDKKIEVTRHIRVTYSTGKITSTI